MRTLSKYEYILNDCIGHLTITQQKIRDLAVGEEWKSFYEQADAETKEKYVSSCVLQPCQIKPITPRHLVVVLDLHG
jgi:hypothetical protein